MITLKFSYIGTKITSTSMSPCVWCHMLFKGLHHFLFSFVLCWFVGLYFASFILIQATLHKSNFGGLMKKRWLKRCSDMAIAPGGDKFIPGVDHANLCLAWNKCISAWNNSPCLDVALDKFWFMRVKNNRKQRKGTLSRPLTHVSLTICKGI